MAGDNFKLGHIPVMIDGLLWQLCWVYEDRDVNPKTVQSWTRTHLIFKKCSLTHALALASFVVVWLVLVKVC